MIKNKTSFPHLTVKKGITNILQMGICTVYNVPYCGGVVDGGGGGGDGTGGNLPKDATGIVLSSQV
jgi:hypothetical protein